MTGTIRTFDPAIEALLKQRMAEIADGLPRAFSATYELTFPFTFPATINSEEGAQLMQRRPATVPAGQIAAIRP